jgi:3-deoxy-D-manno-octulosonic-acid transferase
MFNFAAATDAAQEAGVAIGVADADDLVRTLNTLLADPQRRVAIGAAALAFHATHRGATDRLWAWLAPRLDAALARTAAR